MDDELRRRAAAFIDQQVLGTFGAAMEHFKSRDLVLILTESDREISVGVRGDVAAGIRQTIDQGEDRFDASVLEKLSKPAESAMVASAPGQAFWFIVLFTDGACACIPIGAMRVKRAAKKVRH